MYTKSYIYFTHLKVIYIYLQHYCRRKCIPDSSVNRNVDKVITLFQLHCTWNFRGCVPD